jgi:hypothetical protein
MKKALIIANVVLLACCGAALVVLARQQRIAQDLRAQLAKTASARPPDPASRSSSLDDHAACQQQIRELSAGWSNAAFQLKLAQAKLREREAKDHAQASPPATSAPAVLTPADLPSATTPAPAASPAVTAPPVASTPVAHGTYFATLKGAHQQVLGTNLEFSAVYGRRVAFKDSGSSRRVAFDVDELDPAALAALKINPDAQKASQLQQERAWQSYETASQAALAAEEQQREARKSAEAARQEAERQAAEQAQLNASAAEAAQPNPSMYPPGSPNGTPYPYLLPAWRYPRYWRR